MKGFLCVAGLLVFTLAMWLGLIWAFGEIGILLVVISGYTMPIWALIILDALGIDD